jgi:SLT domain-containing protein
MSDPIDPAYHLKWFYEHCAPHHYLLDIATPMLDVAVAIMHHIHQLNILFVSNVSSEMGRRTSKITSGFVSVAAVSRVKNVTKKGTRDVRRTTLLVQRAVKKNTDVIDSRICTSSRLLASHPQNQGHRDC